ncbi:hypothetical protein C8Q75DRAFT_809094 [Abortiporus biennis]|nr:hypothetical protein C8Q75DRAFT_809094 [Abortiporus biennis]
MSDDTHNYRFPLSLLVPFGQFIIKCMDRWFDLRYGGPKKENVNHRNADLEPKGESVHNAHATRPTPAASLDSEKLGLIQNTITIQTSSPTRMLIQTHPDRQAQYFDEASLLHLPAGSQYYFPSQLVPRTPDTSRKPRNNDSPDSETISSTSSHGRESQQTPSSRDDVIMNGIPLSPNGERYTYARDRSRLGNFFPGTKHFVDEGQLILKNRQENKWSRGAGTTYYYRYSGTGPLEKPPIPEPNFLEALDIYVYFERVSKVFSLWIFDGSDWVKASHGDPHPTDPRRVLWFHRHPSVPTYILRETYKHSPSRRNSNVI